MNLVSRKNAVNKATGNVNAKTLEGSLEKGRKGEMVFGRPSKDKATQDMIDAVKYSSAFSPIVGDSGTASRSALAQYLALSGIGAGGALAGGGDAGDVGVASAVVPLAALLAGRAGAGAYTSDPIRKYLTNTLLPRSTQKAIGGVAGRSGAGYAASR